LNWEGERASERYAWRKQATAGVHQSAIPGEFGAGGSSELLSRNFDPYQPMPSTINLGWPAIENHFLNAHNRPFYKGQGKGGKVTSVFEEENFTAIKVALDNDYLPEARVILYDPESYRTRTMGTINAKLKPGGRAIQSATWHFTDGMPFLCLRLTGKPIPRPEPVYVQEPVLIRKKSRVMEEYEAVFGKSGASAQAQMA